MTTPISLAKSHHRRYIHPKLVQPISCSIGVSCPRESLVLRAFYSKRRQQRPRSGTTHPKYYSGSRVKRSERLRGSVFLGKVRTSVRRCCADWILATCLGRRKKTVPVLAHGGDRDRFTREPYATRSVHSLGIPLSRHGHGGKSPASSLDGAA